MRYLQYDTLQKMGLSHFDDWAASFGETVTAIELSPEGTGYRAKTRFARFFNLPELISLFKESADVQTADMLNLPVPQAEYINEVLKPSETQEEMVSSFADRAEAVRNGSVNPKFDNMLKITNDGRKLALDQRLMNEMLPDEPESKVNRCVDNAFKDCASKGQQAVNLFSGIVRCGGCGQNMVRRTVSKNGKKYIYLHCVTNHNGLGCSSHLISESKLAEVVLAALQGKVQQISGLEHRLDEINEIPKNERRLKSVEEHLKMLEQEEQKYQTLRRQLYEDMSSGIVSKEEYKEFSHSFNEKVETIRKAKAEMPERNFGQPIRSSGVKASQRHLLHRLAISLTRTKRVHPSSSNRPWYKELPAESQKRLHR